MKKIIMLLGVLAVSSSVYSATSEPGGAAYGSEFAALQTDTGELDDSVLTKFAQALMKAEGAPTSADGFDQGTITQLLGTLGDDYNGVSVHEGRLEQVQQKLEELMKSQKSDTPEQKFARNILQELADNKLRAGATTAAMLGLPAAVAGAGIQNRKHLKELYDDMRKFGFIKSVRRHKRVASGAALGALALLASAGAFGDLAIRGRGSLAARAAGFGAKAD